MVVKQTILSGSPPVLSRDFEVFGSEKYCGFYSPYWSIFDESSNYMNLLFPVVFSILFVIILRKGGALMGGHYEKDMYEQFCEMAERLDSLEKGRKQDHKEIKCLNKELDRVNKRNTVLEKKVASQGRELTEVRAENKALKKENQILRKDNERMKRILNNSDNSSLPPSSDKSNISCKAAN